MLPLANADIVLSILGHMKLEAQNNCSGFWYFSSRTQQEGSHMVTYTPENTIF
jgi:hypothetical protein